MIKPQNGSSELHWLALAVLALAAFFFAKAAQGVAKVILWLAFFAGGLLLARYLLK